MSRGNAHSPENDRLYPNAPPHCLRYFCSFFLGTGIGAGLTGVALSRIGCIGLDTGFFVAPFFSSLKVCVFIGTSGLFLSRSLLLFWCWRGTGRCRPAFNPVYRWRRRSRRRCWSAFPTRLAWNSSHVNILPSIWLQAVMAFTYFFGPDVVGAGLTGGAAS